MKIDLSPEAVSSRMRVLDQLWELTVALKSSVILAKQDDSNPREKDRYQESKDDGKAGT